VRDLLVSQTWVEERRKRWGEDNPLFIAKVKGEFPDAGGEHNVIPWAWIKLAQRRNLEPSESVSSFCERVMDLARCSAPQSYPAPERTSPVRARTNHTSRAASSRTVKFNSERDIPR
jgi:hypothetical protein